jgi:putative transposase
MMRRPFTHLFCHLVWSTWDRLPLITPEVEPRLYGAIRCKLRELGCAPIAVGGVEDHVHVLCQFPPTVAIAYLVGQVKGASSHLMNHEVLGIDAFKWQGSYGAFTLDRNGVTYVEAYVLAQKQHHADRTLWEDFERTWLPDDPAVPEGGDQ